MERLTIDEIIEHCDRKTEMCEKVCGIKYLETTTMNNPIKEYWEHKQVAEYLRKLKEYEDLEERLNKVYGDCDGLLLNVVEALEKHSGIDITNNTLKSRLLTDEDVDKWEEYKQLEEQGRLVKLPCKVGDVVYAYCDEFGILEYEVDSIVIDKHITYQCSAYSEPIGDCPSECLDEIEPDIADFGKTVFLTKSEAEAKLKELRGEENEN